MRPRVDFLTLATADLSAARGFYQDGLGWKPTLDVPGEIVFFQVGHGLVLGLFDADHFAAEIGADKATPVTGITLSHNVDSRAEVDRTVAAALEAGGTLITEPRIAGFGGYHGHFSDPNGIVWEIAHNPGWSVDEDGTVRLGPVTDERTR